MLYQDYIKLVGVFVWRNEVLGRCVDLDSYLMVTTLETSHWSSRIIFDCN